MECPHSYKLADTYTILSSVENNYTYVYEPLFQKLRRQVYVALFEQGYPRRVVSNEKSPPNNMFMVTLWYSLLKMNILDPTNHDLIRKLKK